MAYILCTRSTIPVQDQYIQKQDGVHLSGNQMVGLSSIQMALENWTIDIQPLFDHSNTQPVWYSDPHCI